MVLKLPVGYWLAKWNLTQHPLDCFRVLGSRMLSSVATLHLRYSSGFWPVLVESEEVSHHRRSDQKLLPALHFWAWEAAAHYLMEGYRWDWAWAPPNGTRNLNMQVIEPHSALKPDARISLLIHIFGYMRKFPMTGWLKNKNWQPALPMLS